MSVVCAFRPKDTPKTRLLNMLDELRASVVRDEVAAVVVVPLRADKKFGMRFAGEISMDEVVSMLDASWLEARSVL